MIYLIWFIPFVVSSEVEFNDADENTSEALVTVKQDDHHHDDQVHHHHHHNHHSHQHSDHGHDEDHNPDIFTWFAATGW